MHWLIFLELQRFAGSKEIWNAWISKANIPATSFYLGIISNSDTRRLIATGAEISGKSVNQFLNDFGKFCAPHLVAQFSHLIEKEWDLFDFLEHTEEYIHKVVRQIPGTEPPNLRSLRLDNDKILIRYNSSFSMCAFAEGIIEQASKIYDEKITISQPKCMLRGDPECEILMTRTNQ